MDPWIQVGIIVQKYNFAHGYDSSWYRDVMDYGPNKPNNLQVYSRRGKKQM